MKTLRVAILTYFMTTIFSAVTAFRGILSRQNVLRSRRHCSFSSMNKKPNSSLKSSSIEVEEKFVVPRDIEERLRKWGFVRQQQFEMTDWYFDTPNLDLLQQNIWLRCRQPEMDQANLRGEQDVSRWKIKIGQQHNNTMSLDGSVTPTTTVYIESEGLSALEKAAMYLQNPRDATIKFEQLDVLLQQNTSLFATRVVPRVPDLTASASFRSQLVPFARIFARRTSWRNVELNIQVDLDETDFGHAVGEVEMVVENETNVESARTKVREWVIRLQETSSTVEESSPPLAMGKLEYYLYHFRPQVYNVCIQCGVLG